MTKAYIIEIKGLVQGVGFRPFIYRLAKEYHLAGWVINNNEGVILKVQSSEKFEIESFIKAIRDESPVAARVESITYSESETEDFHDFQILKSSDSSDEITEISPDIAVCDDCLADMKVQANRIDYPFINCTNCGPRFSIIEDASNHGLINMMIFNK